LSPVVASALPVSYDETVHGDLPIIWPSSNFPWLGELDTGINTIAGTVSRRNGAADDTWDAFRVTLPHGLSIDYVEVSISNFTGMDLGSGGEIDYTQIGITTIYTDLFSGDETFKLINIFPTDVPTDYSFDIFPTFRSAFDWEIDIEAVPEPPTILLLGSGLIGLTVFSRKVRNR
jgi:hypothetical protein